MAAPPITPAEAFRLLCRALLRAQGCPESLSDEISSYKWFHQFQRFSELAPGRISVFRRSIRMDAATAKATAPLRRAAFKAIALLTKGVRSGKVGLEGVVGPGEPSAEIAMGERRRGEFNVFAATLKVYWNPQSLQVARTYTDVVCVEDDVLKLIPPTTPEAGAARLKRPRRRHHRPAGDPVKTILQTLYPNGVPSQDDLPDDKLVSVVLKQRGVGKRPPPSKSTILRAAGRRDDDG